MAENVDLKVDWATHEAAKYACEHWHYSKCLPVGKMVKVGAWEFDKFIGVVLFGRGANNNMSQAYGLSQDEACELVRVALRDHASAVTQIISASFKFLKKQSQGIRLIISYADPEQGHHGGIYQAGNWIYSGRSKPQKNLVIGGVETHKRSASKTYGTASPIEIEALTGKKTEWSTVKFKFTYLMPLDKKMRKQILPLSKPYPKKEEAEKIKAEYAANKKSVLQRR